MRQIATNNSGVWLYVREILVQRSETVNYTHLVYDTLTSTVTLCTSNHPVSTDSLPILWTAILLTPTDECLTSTEILKTLLDKRHDNLIPKRKTVVGSSY